MPGCLSQLPLDFSSSLDPIRVVSSSPVWGSRLSVEHTKKNADLGAPGWLSLLSIWLLILAQVMILESWDRAPHQALHRVWSLLKILSLLLLALSQPMWSLPPHSFSLKGKKKRSKEVSSLAIPGKAEYVDVDVGTLLGVSGQSLSKSSSGCFIFLTEAGSKASSWEERWGRCYVLRREK